MTPSLAVLSTSLHRCPVLVASLELGACLLSSTSRLLSKDVRDLQEHNADNLCDLFERKEDVWSVGMMGDERMDIASVISMKEHGHSRYKTE